MKDKAELIVEAIIGDLSDRSGLGGEWDGIDRITEREIFSTWVGIVRKVLEEQPND